jgi:hypothetical protein
MPTPSSPDPIPLQVICMNTPPCPRMKSIHLKHHIAASIDKLQKNDNDSVPELHTMANTPSLDQSSSSSPSQDSTTNVYNDENHETYVVEEYDEKNRITRTYQLGKLLGKGSFAKVYLCTVAENEQHRFAMKIIPKAPLVHRPIMNEVRCTVYSKKIQCPPEIIHLYCKMHSYPSSFQMHIHVASRRD